MQIPTKEIITPIQKRKVVIKEYITGRDREYINEPMYSAVETTPKIVGGKTNIEFPKVDVQKFITESQHREIEKFVVSVDGKTEKILDEVLDMHENDSAFVTSEINKISKKNVTPTT